MVKKIKKRTPAKEEASSPVVSLVCGLAAAYAITCIVFIIYALILTYTWASEEYISLVALACTVVSTAVAGYDAAKGAKSRGIFWGMGAGLIYALLLFVIGFFANDGIAFDSGKLITLVISLAGGGIGGVLGINRR